MDPGLREFGADYSDHDDPKPRKQQILGIEPGLRQLAKKETPTEYGADYNIADDDGSKTKIDKENKNGNKTEKTGNKTETTVKGGDDNGYYYTYYYNYYEPEHGNETNNGTADNGPEEFGIDYGVGHENSNDNDTVWYWYAYPEGEGDGENDGKNKTEHGDDYGVGHKGKDKNDIYYYTYEYEDSGEITTTIQPKNNENGISGSDYMDFGDSKHKKQKHFQKNKTTTKATTTPIKKDTSPIDPFNKDFNIFTDIAG